MNEYSSKLHELIPGGAHTYSRGDDQFPFNAPPILERGKGAYVWPPNGQKILDYGMGLRSVNLGYANEEVAEVVYLEALKGNNLTRASVTELEAAQLFVDCIPSVEMVKFAKHGSTVTTAAYKLARAYTGRKYIAVPVEHPFFSFDDWFIGSTPLTKGIPSEFTQFTLKFNYNDIHSLEKLMDEYQGQIAAVMLEPASAVSPKTNEVTGLNFLQEVQALCRKDGAVFILDEMITGFRWHLNGAQTYYNVTPDLTTFGKAMANGFAVAALGGKKEIMDLGNITQENQERVFLTSTTHGAEMSALGAFMKTIEIIKRENVINHFWDFGNQLMDGSKAIIQKYNLENHFIFTGLPCSPNYVTMGNDVLPSMGYRTLFAEKMMEKDVMIPYIAVSMSHRKEELDITLDAMDHALDCYSKALTDGLPKYLKSKEIKPVFRKYN